MNGRQHEDRAQAGVQQALERLQGLLPLAARLRGQDAAARKLHRAVLWGFARRGRVPDRDVLVRTVLPHGLDAMLVSLADADLVLLGQNHRLIGAYPFTLEPTPHALTLSGGIVNAMCAVDALAVAPVFDCAVAIASQCAVTGTPIAVRQQGGRLLSVLPSEQLQIGIGWHDPQGCAAHSLCREMVFLRDQAVAARWRSGNPDDRAVYRLEQAIALGTAFFSALLDAGL